MKRGLWLVFVLSAFAVLGTSALAQAQVLVGDIPFKFMAAGRMHDPGRYELRVSEDESGLTVTPEGKGLGAGIEVLALTRLASPAGGVPESRLVFDKVGDTYYLSEAWFSGEDGFVLHSTREKHTHATIRLNKKDR